jgi:O-antigen ligase
VLEIGSAGLLVVWLIVAVRQKRVQIQRNWMYLPLLGLCGLTLVQLAFGQTAYVHATKTELLRLVAYLCLGFLAVQSIQAANKLKTFLWFMAVLGFCVSLFGIVQFFTWNGKLYWIRAVANAGTSFGPFVARDHFAGFVELTAPFAWAMLFSGSVRRDKMLLVCLLAVLPIGALVLCASRGGILSFLVGLIVLGALLGRRIVVGRKWVVAVLLMVMSGTLVAWLGLEGASRRFKELADSGVARDRRLVMCKDTGRIFLDHFWLGTGLGTLPFVYPRYESYYDGFIVNHAHDGYLELLADTGIVGGFCGIAFLVILFRQAASHLRCVVGSTDAAFYSGALAVCAGFLAHSAVDFNLHIPSNALLFFVAAFMGGASPPPQH